MWNNIGFLCEGTKVSKPLPKSGLFFDLNNRDRGEPHGSSPPTPPYIRVRIRRFGGLSGHLFPQEG
jgi:hypothetical protein